MISRNISRKRWASLAALLSLPLLATLPAEAALPPLPAKQIELVARGQKIDQFLGDLFGQAGLKILVSTAVTGNIQGRFVGRPNEIWTQLSKAFNLVAYYDGAVVRIYSGTEIRSRMITSEVPSGVVGEVARLRLNDANNSVRAGASNVVASGVPFFIEKVEMLAAAKVAKPTPVASQSSPPMTPVAVVKPAVVQTAHTPQSTGIVSPALGKVAGLPAPAPASIPPASGATSMSTPASLNGRLPVRSMVRSYATARFPYEIRVFYLRYARAQDTVRDTGGGQIVIPGVATLLRGVMGDGRPSTTVATSGNFERGRYPLSEGVGINGQSTGRVGPDGPIPDYETRGYSSREEGETRDVNGPRIEVDVANNAVIVRDRPEAMSTYESLILSTDIESPMIELEATIIELNTSRARELGLDFAFSSGGINAVFGGTLQPTTSGPSGTLQGSFLTGSGTLVTARLNALERSGTVRVVSKPRANTMNNLEAVFGNETKVFLPISGERVADLRAISAGLVLRVTPSIIYDGGELRTRMTIYIQDGSVTRGPDGTASVQQSQINTQAVVKQGEVVLLGGMTMASEYDTKSKTPVLSDIPLAGNAFKKRQRGGERIERLFLITPRIMSQAGGSGATASQASQLIPIEMLEGRKPVARR